MSLDLLTICSPLGSLCLAAGDAVMEQGRISDLAATAFPLCSAALKHQYLMHFLPFLLLQLPPDFPTHSCTQHVLLPLTYGTLNFPCIQTRTQGYFILREGQGMVDAPKNVAVKLET